MQQPGLSVTIVPERSATHLSWFRFIEQTLVVGLTTYGSVDHRTIPLIHISCCLIHLLLLQELGLIDL